MKKGFLVSSIALVLSSSLSNTAFALPIVSLGTEAVVTLSETLAEIPRVREEMRKHFKENPPTLEENISILLNEEAKRKYYQSSAATDKIKGLENKIDLGDKDTLQKSKEYTDNNIDDLIKSTDIMIHESFEDSKEYTDQISDKNNKAHQAKFQQIESMHAKAQAQNETRFSHMDKKISKTAKQANSGIASVAAMSNIPYAMNTRFSLGAGLGNYRNGNAVAVGAQYQIKENVNLRSSVSWNNSDSAVIGAGIAIGW